MRRSSPATREATNAARSCVAGVDAALRAIVTRRDGTCAPTTNGSDARARSNTWTALATLSAAWDRSGKTHSSLRGTPTRTPATLHGCGRRTTARRYCSWRAISTVVTPAALPASNAASTHRRRSWFRSGGTTRRRRAADTSTVAMDRAHHPARGDLVALATTTAALYAQRRLGFATATARLCQRASRREGGRIFLILCRR